MSSLLVFTGSPSANSLQWNEEELANGLLPAFHRESRTYLATESTHPSPAWRSLPLKAPHLPSGMTQLSGREAYLGKAQDQVVEIGSTKTNIETSSTTDAFEDSRFLDTQSPVPYSQVKTQYYEHSFEVHEELQSSQIIGSASTDGLSSSAAAETELFQSFESSDIESSDIIIHPQKQAVHARLHSASVCDLKEIPNAGYLHSIAPQTMTFNLVVGVISLSQPRRIEPRKGGRPVELIEMLVGDETHAGFNINIWIPPAEEQDSNIPQNHENFGLRNEVSQLRPRDVILARRVALNSFRNQVYGQSLRRGLTSLDLLFRRTIDAEDSRGVFGAKELDANCEESDQLARVRKVKDWVVQFVGGANPSNRNSSLHSKKAALSALPFDTP